VPEVLQPLLDRVLGSRAAAPITDAKAFLAALDQAISGQSRGPASAPLAPLLDRESASAADVETVEVDSKCVSGILVEPARGTPREAGADVADLPFRKLGHYEIIGRLGQGGMGEVYLGYERGLDRRVAIKVLPSRFACERELVGRFQAEATAAARLIHPNIIQIYFIGEDAGHHFFAMQYVAGMSLSRLLSRRRLTVDEALAISEEILSGLAAAHKLSLVHRDIKPANILLDSEHHRALLADFGLVKSLEEAARGQTATGVVMGTADYMSPEQALGQEVDCRSDLYATGVVMYQMLCGRLPFVARESSAVIYHHVHVPPPNLAETAPDVSAPLAAFVAKLLAKSPQHRYQSASAALADLRALRAGLPLSTAEAAMARQSPACDFDTAPFVPHSTTTDSLPRMKVAPARTKSRRRTVLVLIAGMAAASAIGLGSWHVWKAPDRTRIHDAVGTFGVGSHPPVVRSFGDIPGEVNSFALSGDERTLVIGERSDNMIVRDFQTGEPGRTIRAHSDHIRRVIFSLDDRFAITASKDQTLKLWNTATWKQTKQFTGHVDIVSSVVQVPGRDEIVSSSFDGRLCRWSLQTGNAIAWYGQEPLDAAGTFSPETQVRHVSWVRDLVIPAPGNEVVSAGNDHVILIWDLDSAEVIGRLIEHKMPVMCLAVSRDGTRLLSGGYDKKVCLWDLPGRRLIHSMTQDSAIPACVALSPDGHSAVSGGGDGLIHVWDVETGTERTSWEGHAANVTVIRFTEDGQRLVSAGEDHTIRVWQLPADAR
jgi:serine/threonine protein kinase